MRVVRARTATVREGSICGYEVAKAGSRSAAVEVEGESVDGFSRDCAWSGETHTKFRVNLRLQSFCRRISTHSRVTGDGSRSTVGSEKSGIAFEAGTG